MSAPPAMLAAGSLRGLTLARVFFRSLFLQATWNRRGMQNLGFAYAIEPALRVLYPERERLEVALRRHLGFFNCHPYMAAAILGGAIYHEERVASGLERPEVPANYKQTLQGPLAAIGDGFFWTALRPFFGALGAVIALLLQSIPAIIGVVAVYNIIHLTLRIALFRAGYSRGDALVPLLARLALPVVADRLRTGGAVLCGVAAGVLILHAGTRAGADSSTSSLVALVTAAAAVAGYALLARGARLLPTLYAAAGAGAGAAFVLAHFPGSH